MTSREECDIDGGSNREGKESMEVIEKEKKAGGEREKNDKEERNEPGEK